MRPSQSLRLAAAVAFVLFAAACGGAVDGSGVATLDQAAASDAGTESETSTELTREEALLAFAACLRDHGVDVEDPTVDADGNVQLARPGVGAGPGGGGVDAELRAARRQCEVHLESAALGFETPDRTALEDALLEFARCVRDNGYDLPDPDLSSFGQGPGGGGPFGGIDRSDPELQQASEACEDVLAGIGRGGGERPRGGGDGGG